MEKAEKILDLGSISITNKADIRTFLLLTFYLRKLAKANLQFADKEAAKRFSSKLLRFSEGLSSFG